MNRNYIANLNNYIIQTQNIFVNYDGKIRGAGAGAGVKDRLSKLNMDYLLSKKL